MKSIVIEYPTKFKIKYNTLLLGFLDSPLWRNLKDQNIMKLIFNTKLCEIKHILNATNFIESNSCINSKQFFLAVILKV
jgi:hypothetical protein